MQIAWDLVYEIWDLGVLGCARRLTSLKSLCDTDKNETFFTLSVCLDYTLYNMLSLLDTCILYFKMYFIV